MLSTAKIRRDRVLPRHERARCWRFARWLRAAADRAQSSSRARHPDRLCGSYDALLADPDIEVIYNPLPNHLHVPMDAAGGRRERLSTCCAKKPIGLTAQGGRSNCAARRGKCADLRSSWVRFHPQ